MDNGRSPTPTPTDETLAARVAAGDPASLGSTAPATPGSHEFLCSFGGHPEAGMVGTLIVE